MQETVAITRGGQRLQAGITAHASPPVQSTCGRLRRREGGGGEKCQGGKVKREKGNKYEET